MTQQPCSVSECPRLSRVLCYCCRKDFCIEHLKDHQDVNLSQLYQITNEINLLAEYARGSHRERLDQWRHEAHQTIDRFYEEKCQELERKTVENDKLNENRRVIKWIQSKIVQSIREQNITTEQINSLQAASNAIRRDLQQIFHEDYPFDIPPLILDEYFRQPKINWNLSSTIKSVIQTTNLTTSKCIVMAAGNKYLLVGEDPNLCLFDHHLSKVKQIPWAHGCIWDMCLVNGVGKYILCAEYGIFTLDEQTMMIEHIKTLMKRKKSWYSCACSDESLFLATKKCNSKIREYGWMGHHFIYKRKHIGCLNNEYIEHMKYSNDSLMLIIFNDLTGARRCEMRSTITFDQLWMISLNIPEKVNIVSCCSLNEKGWLIVDFAQARLIHITNQGQIKQNVIYQPSPQYAVQFHQDILAVLTEEGLHLHRIN